MIDGIDWLPTDSLGIDPAEFFSQPALREGGKLLVGRCECGCVGCDDVEVEVARGEAEVRWTAQYDRIFSFPAPDYDRVIESSANDSSWEDANRTVERLVSNLFKGVRLEGGDSFDWASARIRPSTITLSFSHSGTQKVFEFEWNGTDPETAIPGAKRFLAEKVPR